MNIKKQTGFTLIEILVAITIFTFALLGLAIGTVTLTRTNHNSHLNASAINLAQAKLEEFRAMSSAAFSALSCPSYTSTGCSDSRVASNKAFARSWMITPNSPVTGVSRIDVRVDWQDHMSQSLTFTAAVPQ